MFFDALSPVLGEFTQDPLAFLGGFTSGLLRLSPGDDAIASWLQDRTQAASPVSGTTVSGESPNNGSGPQSIEIE